MQMSSSRSVLINAIESINAATSINAIKHNINDMSEITETPFISRVLAQLSVVRSRISSLTEYVEMIKNLKSAFKTNEIVSDATTAPLVNHGSDGTDNIPVQTTKYEVSVGDIIGHGPYVIPITLTATDLPKHYNSNGTLYHWTGIGVNQDAETDALTGVTCFYSTDANLIDFSDKTFNAVSDVEFTSDGHQYRSYYFGYNPENPNRYGYIVYRYQSNDINTYVVYRITFNVSVAE